MGFWNSILGRSRPKAPDLDALFALPSAALTLEAAVGFTPTGVGAICFRGASGVGFAETLQEALDLLAMDESGVPVHTEKDSYGFTWVVAEGDPGDLGGLCTRLHAVNTTLVDEGFGHGLLCTLVPFAAPGGQTFGLVQLFKQSTFYPFAPLPGGQRRDNMLELQVRDLLAAELPMEKDLQRWLALWNAPGL